MFPQISDVNAIHSSKETPFLNILKKPIMSIYDKAPIRSDKRPVCVVGLSKEVETRSAKTGQLKRNRRGEMPHHEEHSTALTREKEALKESIISYSPILLKSEVMDYCKSPSKKSLPLDGLRFYLVGPGNNAKLVEEMIERREGWHPSSINIFTQTTQSSTSGGISCVPSSKTSLRHIGKLSTTFPTTRHSQTRTAC